MADIGSDRRRQRQCGQLVRNPLRQRTGAGAANSIHLDRYAAGRIKFTRQPTVKLQQPRSLTNRQKRRSQIQRSHAAATPSTVPAGSRRYRAVQRPCALAACPVPPRQRRPDARQSVPRKRVSQNFEIVRRGRVAGRPQQQRVNRRPGRVAANAAPPTRPTVRHWVPPPPCSLLASVLEPDHRYARTVTQRGGHRRPPGRHRRQQPIAPQEQPARQERSSSLEARSGARPACAGCRQAPRSQSHG